MKRNHLAAIAAAAALGLAAAAGRTSPRPAAEKWDIQITVDCDGRYGLEAGEDRFDGRYGFTASWVGLMERDDGDFLLIHKGVELERWEAEEKLIRPGRIDILQTQDFTEKPALRVHDILKKGASLEIALSVSGFEVPRRESPCTFRLALPCSAEDGASPAGIHYGDSVAEGSNRVFLDESAIALRTEVKKFAWTWKWRAWIPRQGRPVLTFNSHKAVVTVAVTPHQEEGRPRPGDDIGRKPSSAGRG